MNLYDYLELRRDAFIEKLSRTESGTEYLDNAWRMEQVVPNRKRLREKIGKGGINGE